LTVPRAVGATYGGGENHAFGAFVTRVSEKCFLCLTIVLIFSNHHKCFPDERRKCRCTSWAGWEGRDTKC
jgi:hypothetical protein